MDKTTILSEIKAYKRQKDAIILAHNYQRGEIQDIADVLGDSLDLAKQAAELKNETIVFCGVHFMAESAAILSPGKDILLPVAEAGCRLADCATPEMIRAERKKHPDAVFIAYINTSAAVKAEVDVICTSANAMTILKHYSDKKICYLPDRNLAAYAEKKLGISIVKWPGQCYVHDTLITKDAVQSLKNHHPDAFVMAHPEAPQSVLELADAISGTGGMIKLARNSDCEEFIIATEKGLAYRLQKENPDKQFWSCDDAICSQMKVTKLQNVLNALKFHQHHITVQEPIASRARSALQKMLDLSS
jgi:quinolinate synthase